MKKGQAPLISLLAVIAALLGVIMYLLVKPSVTPMAIGNSAAPSSEATSSNATENPEQTANPIDEIVNDVIANEAAAQPPQVKFTSFPKQFWGNWSQRPERCGGDEDDSMLEITPRSIRAWEASGGVESVTLQNPLTIDVAAKFSGEGEQWETTSTYALSSTRQKMLVSTRNAQPVWYHRCPDVAPGP